MHVRQRKRKGKGGERTEKCSRTYVLALLLLLVWTEPGREEEEEGGSVAAEAAAAASCSSAGEGMVGGDGVAAPAPVKGAAGEERFENEEGRSTPGGEGEPRAWVGRRAAAFFGARRRGVSSSLVEEGDRAPALGMLRGAAELDWSASEEPASLVSSSATCRRRLSSSRFWASFDSSMLGGGAKEVRRTDLGTEPADSAGGGNVEGFGGELCC